MTTLNATTAIVKTGDKHKLSPAESARLAELEPIIERGLGTFAEVGLVLAEISRDRLYRQTHSAFKDYMEEKWKMGVRTAYEHIERAEIVKSLPAECAKFAQTINPAQARELAKVPAEQRETVIKAAAKRGPVTAKAIKLEVVKRSEDASTTAPDLNKFRSAKISRHAARRWWWGSATPAGRGSFIETLMSLGGNTYVPSKAKLRQRFEQWMELYVTEEAAGE